MEKCLLVDQNDRIIYENVIRQYPWIIERERNCILSPDSDGLLCGLFMQSVLDWNIVGFYDGKVMLLKDDIELGDCVFLDMEMDSSCACAPDRASSSSLDIYAVSMFSFSNRMLTPYYFSIRAYIRESTVFLANRDTDLVSTRSIFPLRQSAISLLKSSRLSVLVPVSPSSA